jgi:hypothetical protein
LTKNESNQLALVSPSILLLSPFRWTKNYPGSSATFLYFNVPSMEQVSKLKKWIRLPTNTSDFGLGLVLVGTAYTTILMIE